MNRVIDTYNPGFARREEGGLGTNPTDGRRQPNILPNFPRKLGESENNWTKGPPWNAFWIRHGVFIFLAMIPPKWIDLSTLTVLVYRKGSCLLPYIDYIFDQTLRFWQGISRFGKLTNNSCDFDTLTVVVLVSVKKCNDLTVVNVSC